MDAGAYTIRLARADEIEQLPPIELAAGKLFAGQDLGTFSLDDVRDLATHAAAQREGMLWVAALGDVPVGFAIASRVEGEPHLLELDVHPDHGRRGLGAKLVAAVVTWARGTGAPSITLSTFRDVAWNAPFYARLGFRAIEEGDLGPPYRALLDREVAMGLPRHRRVVMRLSLR